MPLERVQFHLFFNQQQFYHQYNADDNEQNTQSLLFFCKTYNFGAAGTDFLSYFFVRPGGTSKGPFPDSASWNYVTRNPFILYFKKLVDIKYIDWISVPNYTKSFIGNNNFPLWFSPLTFPLVLYFWSLNSGLFTKSTMCWWNK